MNGDEGPDDNPANYGDTLTTKLSYEDLWDRGILQANGLSVNFSDFQVLSADFGKSAAVAAAIPEPSGLVLLGLGSLWVGLLRRRRN